MEGKVNYTAVGVFVVCLSAILFAGIFWLTSLDHGKVYRGYLVYMHEDVTGLTNESPVRFNGVKVGYVESMHLDPHNSKLVKLVLRIQPDVPITTSTYAILIPQGVTGVVTVNLNSTLEAAPLLQKTSGEPYPVIPAHSSLLMQVSSALPAAAADFQKLSASVSQLLNQKNLDLIQQSLTNIAKVSQTMADNSQNFTETMHALNQSLANISVASKEFPQAVMQFRQSMLSVDTTMKSSQLVINHFSTQLMPSAQQTLVNLASATHNVNQLTEELQHNPSMLVRGKQPVPLGPGEK